MSHDRPIEWMRVEAPPEHVPIPTIRLAENGVASSPQTQYGVPVMVQWMVDGRRNTRELALPLPWPPPLPVDNEVVVIDLGTPVTPGQVETRWFQAIDDNGLPMAAADAVWCRHTAPVTGCRITRGATDANWRLVLDIPIARGAHSISVKGTWALAPDSPQRTASGWATFAAGWLFVVERL